jgi:hypothetical protein
MYHDAPDGLSGNEDCGQMSAWYVLSAMGFYPVTPGSPYYAIGSPIFDTVRIHQENQNTFTLIARNNSADHPYIQSITLNNHHSDSLFISHAAITEGSTLVMNMGANIPATKNFIAPPSAITTTPIVTNPLIRASDASFFDTLNISMISIDKGAQIYYAMNGDSPTVRSKKYSKPLAIDRTTLVKAVAINEEGEASKVVTSKFFRSDKAWNVQYVTPYNAQYNGGGERALTDMQSGTSDFHSGSWQGWWGDDMEVIIDLQKTKSISKVGAEFLQDQRAWILMPSKVTFETSGDGKNFQLVATVPNDLPDKETKTTIRKFESSIKAQAVRFIKIKAYNYGTLPSWHVGAGGNAWIFCDEVFAE